MNLGAQYYRPPFPEQKYWKNDFSRMKDSGLNTVQLWVLWSWVESKPGEFNFDDYDCLIELAEQNGLSVVLSTIAEIQPHWIHRIVPDSEMIDHMGHKVISSHRGECHFGITPGGCTDHPEVWKRMENFLSRVANRYRETKNLCGWDAWNELRWNVQADALVCFCSHTIKAYHQWLEGEFGNLEELNRLWKRRYGVWEEVRPGKLPGRPYTEMMSFEHFITCRANQHALKRYDVIKSIDRTHPVTVHGGAPTPLYSGSDIVYALDRGNDWFFADHLDGIGCSSFPKWGGMDDADFGMRLEFIKSASRDKLVWLSELQGGRAAIGFNIYQDVDELSQQRWIWNGIACGADTILFWCWRDEVFGRESSGFGLAGYDGLAENRLRAMKESGRILNEHKELISGYVPLKPEVGVLFSPQSYYLNWAQEGNAALATNALKGYARALVRKSIPYTIVEEEHLNALSHLKILFLPRTIVIDDHTWEKLESFVRNGGTLVGESECGAFDRHGFYRYPQERFLSQISSISEIGRRHLPDEFINLEIAGQKYHVAATQWLTPLQNEDGKQSLIKEVKIGKGSIILGASYLGDAYLAKWTADFENLVELLVKRAGYVEDMEIIRPLPTKDSFVYLKRGVSAGRKIIFVFFPGDQDVVHLRFSPGYYQGSDFHDIISNQKIEITRNGSRQECLLKAPLWRFSVLVGKNC